MKRKTKMELLITSPRISTTSEFLLTNPIETLQIYIIDVENDIVR